VSISQTTDQNNDSLRISPDQVKNVYTGLKQSAQFKSKLSDCIDTANSLNDIIQQQNDSLQVAGNSILKLNSDISKVQEEITKKAVEIQKLEDRKVSWWKKVFYIAIGVLTGILITK